MQAGHSKQHEWAGEPINIGTLVTIARREFRPFVLAVMSCFALGLVYLLIAQPHFRATTLVLVENQNLYASNQDAGRDVAPADMELDSQVEIVRSQQISMRVVERLTLDRDEAFVGRLRLLDRILTGVRETLSFQEPLARNREDVRKSLASGKLRKNLHVTRTPNTKILNISFTWKTPEGAAQIANAFAEEYLAEQRAIKRDRAGKTLAWLRERVEDLRQKKTTAEFTVEQFRKDSGGASGGRQEVTQQQLSDVTVRLASAREAALASRLRYERIRSLMKSTSALPDNIKVEDSRRLTQLSNDIRATSRSLADVASIDGEDAAAKATALEKQLDNLKLQLDEERKRIADAYGRQWKQAKAREKELRDTLRTLLTRASGGDKSIMLGELKREVETYRTLYGEYVKKMQDLQHEQTFVTSDGRVVSVAVPPLYQNHPNILLVLVASIAFGIVVGGALVLFRTLRRNLDDPPQVVA